MKFEKNLELLRKRKGFSQEELSHAIGVSRQTIYTWESGLNYPNILMLKKIATVLDVTTDDLLNGYDVSKLPNKFDSIELKFISRRDEEIKYNEVPNWFVSLKLEEEVCWGLYDDGVKDFSYHLSVLNKVLIHDQEGYEIQVEEYDQSLNNTSTYSLIVNENNNQLYFVGRIYYDQGVKCIESFHDQKFLNNWGIGNKFIGQTMIYQNAENYELTFGGIKQKVIKISYFDPDGTSNAENSYFEVYLNQNYESIFWQRFQVGLNSKISTFVKGNKYGLCYQSLTDRMIFANAN
jgi:transcriptional regulator with XRE-family HTH domain